MMPPIPQDARVSIVQRRAFEGVVKGVIQTVSFESIATDRLHFEEGLSSPHSALSEQSMCQEGRRSSLLVCEFKSTAAVPSTRNRDNTYQHPIVGQQCSIPLSLQLIDRRCLTREEQMNYLFPRETL